MLQYLRTARFFYEERSLREFLDKTEMLQYLRTARFFTKNGALWSSLIK